MKKTSFLILFFALVLLVPLSVKAFDAKSGTSVYVGKNDVIEGTLFAAGQTITIEGKIKGDLICAGQTLNIKGTIDGDVICAGQTINQGGNIGGNLRVAGNSVNISGNIARNAMFFGATAVTDASSTVGWDMMAFGAFAELRGKIGRNLDANAAELVIDGQIGKNVKIKIDAGNDWDKNKKDDKKSYLTIAKTAKIGGNLDYSAAKEGNIEKGAKIAGKTNFNEVKPTTKKVNYGEWVLNLIISIFSALVVGLVLIALWKKPIKVITDKMLADIGPSIGWGAVFFFLAPIACVLLAITIIGLPLAAILIVLWVIAIYLTKILASIMIGRSLLWKGKDEQLIWQMVVGVIAGWLIFSLPFIGWFLALICILWAMGGAWIYLRKA